MVDFELVDYKTVIKWFEFCFGNKPEMLDMQDKKTFWKLSFLCEDKLQQVKDESTGDDAAE
jgi:hypothetical protein